MRRTIAYLTLVLVIAILLMTLWITIGGAVLPKAFLYVGTVILYIATFAGLLRGIIWTVEHFVRWVEDGEKKEDEA